MAVQKITLILLLVFIFAIGTAMANKNLTNWNYDWPYYGHHNATQPKKVIVGGSENWHFGFNYTDWALKNGPFYIGDSLGRYYGPVTEPSVTWFITVGLNFNVFKFDPPNGTNFPHSVYLLPNYWSFMKCDVRRAKKIADVNRGGGGGFEFVLKRWQPYYFACGEKKGFHCNNGMMKFPVMPLIRWF